MLRAELCFTDEPFTKEHLDISTDIKHHMNRIHNINNN